MSMYETGFEYKAVWDKKTRLITWFSLGIMLLIISQVSWITKGTPIKDWALPFIIFVVIASSCITYLYSPKSYTITATQLLIKRPISPLRLDFNNIKSAEAINKEELKYSFRLWGSGGLFGYFGLFTNQKLGKYTAYYTDFSKLIKINTGRIYIISPSNPQEFLSLLSGKLRK